MLISYFDSRALIFLAIFSLLGSVGITQQQSIEELVREAGRLGTEAERIRGEAYKKAQAGGDRKLLLEAERAAAEKFRKALELWRAAGDYDHLTAGAEELSRIYSVLNDYDNAVGCLKLESEFWRARGDSAREVRTIHLLGIRQMQLRNYEQARKTFEKVVEMSRAANQISVESNALDSLAMLSQIAGRDIDAELLRARAKEVRDQMYNNRLPEEKKERVAVKIPSQWIDLPSAPLVAGYRDPEGVTQAVLVNRSTKGIEKVDFGCVEEKDGKAQVAWGLVGVGTGHGGVRPGYYFEPFTVLNGPLNRWTNEKMGCGEKARMAVIKAVYADRTEWEAEGTDWISR
jgi:tetratricopeptide (TPR) repeat protein